VDIDKYEMPEYDAKGRLLFPPEQSKEC